MNKAYVLLRKRPDLGPGKREVIHLCPTRKTAEDWRVHYETAQENWEFVIEECEVTTDGWLVTAGKAAP